MADIEIEIDGRKLTAQPNQTVIQVADEAGIYIPRFCYHKLLTIPANCRMCLVEIEKAPKSLPACATPVAPGMKVFTKSQKTLLAQRAVMEFLLINHPLDCPICDQGGECELQDLAMGYGAAWSHYDEAKRSIADEDLGPLIATDMTRCIYCTRCVRFGDEIAGLREMGALGRGEFTEIGTYIQHAIKSEVSGNIIDLCPVGALTAKPYRFTARPWELDQHKSISPHDCVGTNIHVHTRYGKVMRVVSAENMAINETWIADRDRFSYTGLEHPERLEEPIARINGQWQAVDWEQAFEIAASGLHTVLSEFGGDKIGALASPNSTVEEFYLLQKLMRALDSPHIDHRLRRMDTRDDQVLPESLQLPIALNDLEKCDAILLIGSNIQKEQPIAALRVRKASLKNSTVLSINPVDYRYHFKIQAKVIIAPHHFPQVLQELLDAVNGSTAQTIRSTVQALAEQLKNKQNSCILLGAIALNHPQAALIRQLAQKIAEVTQAKIGYLTEGANSTGAYLAGAAPHLLPGGTRVNHAGLSAYGMLEKPRKAYILLNVEPELDTANAHLAIEAMQQAKLVVAISLYRNPILEKYAHVVLPMGAFTESSGTYVNVEGKWQSIKGCAKAFGASRPAWKILRVLANFMQLEGFTYESSEEVIHELKSLIEHRTPLIQSTSEQLDLALQPAPAYQLSRIGEIPLYAVDSLVRHAEPLQKMQTIAEGDFSCARIHPETANRLGVQEGDTVRVKQRGEADLKVNIDNKIAVEAVYIAGGVPATQHLGDLFGPIEIEKRE